MFSESSRGSGDFNCGTVYGSAGLAGSGVAGCGCAAAGLTLSDGATEARGAFGVAASGCAGGDSTGTTTAGATG